MNKKNKDQFEKDFKEVIEEMQGGSDEEIVEEWIAEQKAEGRWVIKTPKGLHFSFSDEQYLSLIVFEETEKNKN